jgi:hypothetical protein
MSIFVELNLIPISRNALVCGSEERHRSTDKVSNKFITPRYQINSYFSTVLSNRMWNTLAALETMFAIKCLTVLALILSHRSVTLTRLRE